MRLPTLDEPLTAEELAQWDKRVSELKARGVVAPKDFKPEFFRIPDFTEPSTEDLPPPPP